MTANRKRKAAGVRKGARGSAARPASGRAARPTKPLPGAEARSSAAGSVLRPPAPASSRTAPPLVLVVDDFPDNREMYVQYLTFAGYRVAEADDGEDALAKAAGLLPDVVVMDLALPRLDGWEATRRLKRDPLTRDIPVIALTGHGLPEHVERAKQAGCDCFLTKPCTPIALAAEIRRLLEQGQNQTSKKGG